MADQAPDETKIKPRHILAVLSVFTVLVGLIQLYSIPVDSEVVLPKYIWIVGVGLVLFIGSLLIKTGRAGVALAERLALPVRVGWILFSILLSVLAAITMLAFQKGGRENYIPVITFWLAAGMSYLAVFKPGFLSVKKWKGLFTGNKRELALLGLVIVLGAAVRFYKLGQAPAVLNGDEGRMGIMAQLTNSGEMANPFALWENFGALYLQATDLCFKLFGTTAFALRLLPAIGGTLAIPAIYLLARKLAGPRVALISAALIAFSHTHIHFSRTAAVGYIHATWLVPLELYFLFSGIEKRSSWRAALAAILLGIHFSIYLTSQVVSVLAFAFILVAFLVFRSWLKPAWRQVAVFWGGLGLMLIPEAVFILQRPHLFVDRLNTDGTFQSGWLLLTMTNTGKGALQILAERVLHAFLSLIYYPAIDFYGSSIPMLSIISAMLFLVGLVVIVLRKQSPASLLLNGYFWGFTLSVGLFAIPPSADSYRMLIAFPAALIMAGIGLDFILELAGFGWGKVRSAYIAIVTFTLLSLMVFNIWSYFDDFIGRCRYGDDRIGRFASILGTYASSLEDLHTPIFLLSDDNFFNGSHASTQFLSHSRLITNVPDPVDTLSLVSGDIVLANPDRIGELETWAHENPGGQVEYRYDCSVPMLLIYTVP
jgi:hypothetical protein